ncbi:hypothetical protein SS1G_10787 [Sclerotinia sclerotiorum 1980 UF-70]|uniref:Interferon-related developmental regulator N-terminal domain-containing protein n=2 Tax=Sclerotinia sclerotiorum (strain ATCC 18683 / 1980 / Ss-1) TaxID=665079 RepID=A7EZM0_SCLS1|nr:hypothetical protein SS1G_10787 [Sclerotinia sclerotiorum 1980 UF-70]APA12221.1 hypothetical protein sscle_09g069910 [Sclerotinia sclerotiorum 1980 UF-70]EDN94912.1 hypothetical protein SS1G_10787 [Sclerotinia sclerotiorum 1980 UF-70]
MTRDLRRRVLESHKTVSKKAASRVGSKNASAVNSRTQSRNVSRHGSDEEDGTLSDDDSTTWSVNSIDDMLDAQEPHEASATWDQELNDRMEEIIDRKRSSEEGRERTLMAYNHYLMVRYCYDEIESKIGELYPALCKSIKPETGEKEACLALRAVGLTVITCPSEDVYEDIFRTLKQAYQRSEHITVKAAAIRTIAALATYGGASETEIEDLLDEFLEIVESDGNSVDAPDSAEVVTAACEEWGSLATFVDDLEERSEAAMEAFVDQLESSSTSVRIAAGENIAIIYEKSYTPRESDDPDASENEKVDEYGFPLDVSQVKRYEPYRQKNQLEHTLSELAKASSKSISKKDRKTLHATFGDVLATIKYPVRGPKYSNVIDEDGHLLGSRMFVRIHKTGVMKIDKWWKLHRLQALRRVLGGGFMTHYQNNEVVLQSLPALVTRN